MRSAGGFESAALGCGRSALELSGERELAGQVALVTGATSGLGRATAIALAQAGANLVLLARGEKELDQVAAEAAHSGVRALPVPVDLAEAEHVLSAAERALSEFGGVDLLVNSGATDAPGGIEGLAATDWDRVLAVNLRAPFLLSKAVFFSVHPERGPRHNRERLLGRRQAGMGKRVRVLRVEVRARRLHAGAQCRRQGPRDPGLRRLPRGDGDGLGAWSAAERHALPREPSPAARSLPPEDLAALIVWIAAAPKELVLNEVIATPLEEQGWP